MVRQAVGGTQQHQQHTRTRSHHRCLITGLSLACCLVGSLQVRLAPSWRRAWARSRRWRTTSRSCAPTQSSRSSSLRVCASFAASSDTSTGGCHPDDVTVTGRDCLCRQSRTLRGVVWYGWWEVLANASGGLAAVYGDVCSLSLRCNYRSSSSARRKARVHPQYIISLIRRCVWVSFLLYIDDIYYDLNGGWWPSLRLSSDHHNAAYGAITTHLHPP